MKKFPVSLAVVAVLAVSLFFVFNSNSGLTGNTVNKITAELYYSSTCGCCKNYIVYLRNNGFDVKPIETLDLNGIKSGMGIPSNMRSCHTTKVGNYFVEGHVPVEAIKKLISEQPEIDGIALPDMPSGSPGMTGTKSGMFTIYSISDGSVGEFVKL